MGDVREFPCEELLPEGPEIVFLPVGEDAALGSVPDALEPAVGDGYGEVLPGSARDGLERVPVGGLVEAGSAGGLGIGFVRLLDLGWVEATVPLVASVSPVQAGNVPPS